MRKSLLVLMIMITLTLTGCSSCQGCDIGNFFDEMMQTEQNGGVTSEQSEETGSGGNPYKHDEEAKLQTISVLVSEDKYYCNNEVVAYEDLMDTIHSYDGNVIVYLSEDNATHKAYDKLYSALYELEIEVVEE